MATQSRQGGALRFMRSISPKRRWQNQKNGCVAVFNVRDAVAGSMSSSMLPNSEIVDTVYSRRRRSAMRHWRALIVLDHRVDTRKVVFAAETAELSDDGCAGIRWYCGGERGTLTFMVGGTDKAFARARASPSLQWARRSSMQAAVVGSGSRCCNNMLLGASWSRPAGHSSWRRSWAGPPDFLTALPQGFGSELVNDRRLPSSRRWSPNPADNGYQGGCVSADAEKFASREEAAKSVGAGSMGESRGALLWPCGCREDSGVFSYIIGTL